MEMEEKAVKEKKRIALTSVIAAVFLASFKLVVGFATGSLGIISEALHSGLDLVAAMITFFAVRVADKPADVDHNYGHGKIENYSALVETLLLLITCIWIIYEAVKRLVTHNVEIDVTVWSYIVIVISIIVDISRSRALYRVAKKYNSQALEADALHFSTDIFSSLVVLAGLIGASLSFYYADTIAAMIVSIIVLSVSYRLGKRSFDVLIDRAPEGIREQIEEIVSAFPEVIRCHDLKLRESGPYKFLEMNIHVDRNMTIEHAHEISHKVEAGINEKFSNMQVTIHAEPENNTD